MVRIRALARAPFFTPGGRSLPFRQSGDGAPGRTMIHYCQLPSPPDPGFDHARSPDPHVQRIGDSGMTRLAREHDAINLAQGFPNFPTPDILKQAAAQAIASDINQYAITWGSKRLRDALTRRYAEWYGMEIDPEREITVTCGATEAMAATVLGLVNPGDEVIVPEPFYENYGPDAILCDARPVFVPLLAGRAARSRPGRRRLFSPDARHHR